MSCVCVLPVKREGGWDGALHLIGGWFEPTAPPRLPQRFRFCLDVEEGQELSYHLSLYFSLMSRYFPK
jgi:hypothetical protein